MRRAGLVATVSILCALLWPVSAEAQFEYQGLPVRSVELEADSELDRSPLMEVLAVEVGQPLSIVDLQSSIKALFATGSFRDIRVDAERVDGAVALTFRLSLHYRVDQVRFEIEGELPDRARREVSIEQGLVLSLDRVDQNALDMVRILERTGYLEATVDPEVRFRRQENLATVVFHVASGPRARIESIDFQGPAGPFSRQVLLSQMESAVGDGYELTRAREDAQRISHHLLEQGYRMAEVRFGGAQYDSGTASVALQYQIDVGPRVEVDVEGVSRDEVRRLIPFEKDEAYSEDLLLRAADRIRDHYQKRGFFFVDVETTEQLREGGEYVIAFRIDAGEKFELRRVRFEGNGSFSDDKLREVVAVSPPGALTRMIAGVIRRPTGFTSGQLSDDEESLENFYRLNGFASAEVSRSRINTMPDNQLEIVFPIEEGPQTIVSSVRVEGADRLAGELPELQITEGEPLSPEKLNGDLVNLQTFYGNRGYIEIQVQPQVEWSEDRRSASVLYQVTEGPKVRIGSLTVGGNSYTDSDVILQKARLESGDVFSYRKLLEAQQRLYRMGIFRLVDMNPVPSSTAEDVRNVAIRIDEGKNLTVTGSVGYATEDGARGSASVSNRNLFGTGRFLGLETTISQRINRYQMNYREPFIFGYDLPTQLTVFKSDELRADEKAKIDSRGTSVEMTKILRDQLRWSVRYEYRVNECVSGELCELATGNIPIEGIDPEDQEIEISSITPSAFWDRRNDAVHPTDGFYVGSSLEYAFPLQSAETNFLKGFMQSAIFVPVSRDSQIVASLRLGATEPLARSGASSNVPFAERFLAGGETTHRGFDHDRLGVPCETLIVADLPEGMACEDYIRDRKSIDFIPVGGNGLVLFNVEYRFPIFGALRGAAFVDAGNIWREYDSVDISEMRYAVGTGLRYLTPVGPLRFDAGYKLDREPWESSFELFLTLGYAF